MTSRSDEARCLTRPKAAAYCGLSPRGFDDWVRRDIMPGPIIGTHRWDRVAIDRALDKLSGLHVEDSQSEDAFDRWNRTRHESRAEGRPSR